MSLHKTSCFLSRKIKEKDKLCHLKTDDNEFIYGIAIDQTKH